MTVKEAEAALDDLEDYFYAWGLKNPELHSRYDDQENRKERRDILKALWAGGVRQERLEMMKFLRRNPS